jgi:hypothetical protein
VSLSKSDTAKLLAFCAAYDQRTIGKSDVEAWAEALDSPWVPDIGMGEAQEAVVCHYRDTPQRITVADVLKRVKAARSDRLSRALPPRRASTEPTEEYRQARADGLLERPMRLKDRLAARRPEDAP